MKTFELTPINGRRSFNGKAKVVETEGVCRLLSYDTHVATYDSRTNKMKVFGYYSATTLTHINAFLSYFGFDTCTKQQLIEYYNLEK